MSMLSVPSEHALSTSEHAPVPSEHALSTFQNLFNLAIFISMSDDKVLSEAESLVNRWIKHSYGNSTSRERQDNPTTSHQLDDVITSAFHKASHGSVTDAVDDILNGLRELPIENEILQNVDRHLNPQVRDPRVAMERRQRKLGEKKRDREERKKIRQENERKEQEVSTLSLF